MIDLKGQDERELRDILSENPFLKVVDKWQSQLADFNSGKVPVDDLKFVLDGDDAWITDYQEKNTKAKKKDWDATLHLELLPNVFCGDPRSPVWILLLNPGFSEIDWYDHLGLCPICKERLVLTDGQQVPHPTGCASKWFMADYDNQPAALKFRQDTMLSQLKLSLDGENGFFWADKRFRTISPENKTVVGKGGSLWWKECLFGSSEQNGRDIGRNAPKYILPACGISEYSAEIGKKLFVLELFPYHSWKFDRSVISRKKSLYRKSKYFIFWSKLVGWAAKTDRILIGRSNSVRDCLKGNDVFMAKRKNILYPSSWQNTKLTLGNFKNNDTGINALYKALKCDHE